MFRCSDLAHNSLTSLGRSWLLASTSLVSLNMSHNLLASLSSPLLLVTDLVMSSAVLLRRATDMSNGMREVTPITV